MITSNDTLPIVMAWAEKLLTDEDEINAKSRVSLDSMALVQLALSIEREFDISVSQDDLDIDDTATVEAIAGHLASAINRMRGEV